MRQRKRIWKRQVSEQAPGCGAWSTRPVIDRHQFSRRSQTMISAESPDKAGYQSTPILLPSRERRWQVAPVSAAHHSQDAQSIQAKAHVSSRPSEAAEKW